ncbi:MAG TPA: hypothetical protein PLB55_14460 [Prosthecobacter sp.]|nr:hypothetical protein [Prosthecobacter sp.]
MPPHLGQRDGGRGPQAPGQFRRPMNPPPPGMRGGDHGPGPSPRGGPRFTPPFQRGDGNARRSQPPMNRERGPESGPRDEERGREGPPRDRSV